MSELNIEYLPISELVYYVKNPRKNDTAVGAVAKSIEEFGFKIPILIDDNNEIIAGHTRLKAAQSLELEKVPVIRVSDLTPEQIKAFRIADNKLGEISEWDKDLLVSELSDLKQFDFDLDLTGFNEFEISSMLPDFIDNSSADGSIYGGGITGGSPPEDFPSYDDDIPTEHRCPKCGYEWSGKSA